MVTLRGRPDSGYDTGEGLGSSSRAGQLDDQMQEFLSSEITRNILVTSPKSRPEKTGLFMLCLKIRVTF